MKAPTFVHYRVEIVHHDDGEIDVEVFDVGSSPRDRESVAWALREAAKRVEEGAPMDTEKLN